MSKVAGNLRLSSILFYTTLLLMPHTVSGDTNFPGNVALASNLVVNGSISATNIVPNEADTSISISGSDTDNSGGAGHVNISGGVGGTGGDGGSVIILGGSAQSSNMGGDVILQGGSGTNSGYGGNVVLKNSDTTCSGCAYQPGNIQLQTGEGTTRFSLGTDGSLNANNNAIINLKGITLGGVTVTNWTAANGKLLVTNVNAALTVASNLVVKGTISVTNISPNYGFSMPLNITGDTGVPALNGGAVNIKGGLGISEGGAFGWDGGVVTITGGETAGDVDDAGGVGGDVVLQGGLGHANGGSGSVILKNRSNDSHDNGETDGYVELQTDDGTTRFWLQEDGSLNGNGNSMVNVHIGAQGDLSMGSFTNSPH